MMGVLNSRPTSFPSLEAAIKWASRAGVSKNKAASMVSLPSQLRREGDLWLWRTPLDKSREYWEGWYTGLSEAFLKVGGCWDRR